MDENPRLRMTRTEITNDPSRIAAHAAMVSVNTRAAVDLAIRPEPATSTGASTRASAVSRTSSSGRCTHIGGHAVIALRSWHEERQLDDRATAADPVTSFQHSALITEQGCAQIFGRSQRAQAD